MANSYSEESGIIILARAPGSDTLPEHLLRLLSLLVPREELLGAGQERDHLTHDNRYPPHSLGYALHSEGDTIYAEDDKVFEALGACALAAARDADQVRECSTTVEVLQLCFVGTEHETLVAEIASDIADSGEIEPTQLLAIAMRLPGSDAISGYLSQYGYYGGRTQPFSAGGSCSMAVRRPDGSIHQETFNPHAQMLKAFAQVGEPTADERVVLHVRGGALQGAWSTRPGQHVFLHDEDLLEEAPIGRQELARALYASTAGLHEVNAERSPELAAAIAAAGDDDMSTSTPRPG
ncbi:MAG: hypothetical protein K0Q43_162 [Ramlibacter sp.]|jgi:hypothetical protein|nr:hypothetical protein [Ramlibacter sp.]